MKKYYLDTSTVRQYSNKLEKFKNKNIFTSILVIFELLSGVNNEKEFFLRKSVIKNLCKSNIQIDWSFYIEKMYQSSEMQKYIFLSNILFRYKRDCIPSMITNKYSAVIYTTKGA